MTFFHALTPCVVFAVLLGGAALPATASKISSSSASTQKGSTTPTVSKVLTRFKDFNTLGCVDIQQCFIATSVSLFTFNASQGATATRRQINVPKNDAGGTDVHKWYPNTIQLVGRRTSNRNGGASRQKPFHSGGNDEKVIDAVKSSSTISGSVLGYMNYKNGMMGYALMSLSEPTSLSFASTLSPSELGPEPLRTPAGVTAFSGATTADDCGNFVIATFGKNVTLVSADGGLSFKNIDVLQSVSPPLPVDPSSSPTRSFSYLLGIAPPLVAIISQDVWFMQVWDDAIIPAPPPPYKYFNQHIMKTRDGGRSFEVVFSLNVTDYSLQSSYTIAGLTCVDAMRCFVAVREASISVLMTEDGGKTWKDSGASSAGTLQYPLRHLQSRGDVVAFSAGSYSLYYSVNAGKSWQTLVRPAGNGYGGISSLIILPSNEGFMFASREQPEFDGQFTVFRVTV